MMVRVTVVEQEKYDGGLFHFGSSYEEGSLDRVIASLNAIREQIPEEYRATACCEIDSTSGYEGSHYPSVSVTYTRPETSEESAARNSACRARAASVEANERAALAALQAKYGRA